MREFTDSLSRRAGFIPLDPGLYEQVINCIVKKNIADITARVREKKLEEGDSHTLLSSYLDLFFRHALSLVPEERLRDYRRDDR